MTDPVCARCSKSLFLGANDVTWVPPEGDAQPEPVQLCSARCGILAVQELGGTVHTRAKIETPHPFLVFKLK